MKKEIFCSNCGRKFIPVGREHICPSCKEAAAAAAKRAAVLKAKRASWAGESVPVRISGRASTVIREYGAEKGLPFAASLDALLKASTFFQSAGKAWEEVEPYRSHRRDKHTTTDNEQDAPQGKQDAPQGKQGEPVKTASKAAKTRQSKTAGKTASKASAGKKEGKKA